MIIGTGNPLIDHRCAGQRRIGIRVKLLQHIDRGGVEELCLIIRLGIEFTVRNIIGVRLLVVQIFLVRTDGLAGIEELSAHIDLVSQGNRAVTSFSGNRPPVTRQPVVGNENIGVFTVGIAVVNIQSIGGCNAVVLKTDFTCSMACGLILAIIGFQRARIRALNRLLAGSGYNLHIAHRRLHIHRQIAVRRFHNLIREGENHLQIAGSKGLCIVVVELVAGHTVGVFVRIGIRHIKGIAADLQVQNRFIRSFRYAGKHPAAAVIAGGITAAAIERRRVVGIIRADDLFILVVPVHVEGGCRLPFADAVVRFLIFLQRPEYGNNAVAAAA